MAGDVFLEWQLAPGRDRSYLALLGELDMSAPSMLDGAVEAVAQAGDGVIIDLARVTFLDGMGMRALMDLTQRLADRGVSVSFGAAPTPVSRYLRLTGRTLAGSTGERRTHPG